MVCRWRPDSSGLGNRYAIPTSANQRRLRNLGSCQVFSGIMIWHNGRTQRSPNPNPAEVLRDCVTNGERSAAHSILARSLGSNKGRIHLRRPTCHSHFSLAARRRTIHSGWPQSDPSHKVIHGASSSRHGTPSFSPGWSNELQFAADPILLGSMSSSTITQVRFFQPPKLVSTRAAPFLIGLIDPFAGSSSMASSSWFLTAYSTYLAAIGTFWSIS